MPDENRAKAKAETTKPTAVLFTPKDLTNTGIAGKMMPKPNATKNEAMMTTWTSRENPATDALKLLTKSFARRFVFSFAVLRSCAQRNFT